MVALYNTTVNQGPEMILSSVNLYLDQYEPLYLVFMTIAIFTALYTVFPRLNMIMRAVTLSLVCVEYFRAYQRDVDTMNDATAFWYSVGGSILSASLTYTVARVFI